MPLTPKKLTVRPAKERRAARETLSKVRKLFGSRGEYWTQNAYVRREAGGERYSYCLIGALREADGPGENLAGLVLASLLDKEDYVNEKIVGSVSSLIKRQRPSILDIIIGFNDDNARQFNEINRLIQRGLTYLDNSLALEAKKK